MDQPTALAYSVGSWKLLKVLEEHEDLALMVREISYDQLWKSEEDGAHDPRISSVAITDEHALSTFLRLAKNATVLTFLEALRAGTTYLESLATYGPKIRTLRLPDCRPTRPGGPTGSTRNITQLETSRLDYVNGMEEFIYPNLTHLDLEDQEVTRGALDCLESVFPNLEVLKINVAVAVELDYAKMPHLHYLHLYNIEDSGELLTSRSDDVTGFWNSLSRSPSIRTLSFEACAYECKYERFMFDLGYSHASLPTLETIRFDKEVRLDRVKFILEGRLSESLLRLVIPTSRSDSGGRHDTRREREARAIVAMCEGTGIEVLLEDRQEVLWDTWCKSFNSSFLDGGRNAE